MKIAYSNKSKLMML